MGSRKVTEAIADANSAVRILPSWQKAHIRRLEALTAGCAAYAQDAARLKECKDQLVSGIDELLQLNAKSADDKANGPALLELLGNDSVLRAAQACKFLATQAGISALHAAAGIPSFRGVTIALDAKSCGHAQSLQQAITQASSSAQGSGSALILVLPGVYRGWADAPSRLKHLTIRGLSSNASSSSKTTAASAATSPPTPASFEALPLLLTNQSDAAKVLCFGHNFNGQTAPPGFELHLSHLQLKVDCSSNLSHAIFLPASCKGAKLYFCSFTSTSSPCVAIDKGSLELEHCSFSHSRCGVLAVNGAAVTARHCSFTDINGHHAIEARAAETRLTLSDCSFSRCGPQPAVKAYAGCSSLIMEGCSVKDCGSSGGAAGSFAQGSTEQAAVFVGCPKAVMAGCTVINCRKVSGVLVADCGKLTAKDCEFSRNRCGVMFGLGYGKLEKCKVVGNTSVGVGVPCASAMPGKEVVLEGCELVGNGMVDIMGSPAGGGGAAGLVGVKVMDCVVGKVDNAGPMDAKSMLMDPRGAELMKKVVKEQRKQAKGVKKEAKGLGVRRTCVGCGQVEGEDAMGAGKFGKCTGCGVVAYCSRECQKKDWKVYKPVCQMMSK